MAIAQQREQTGRNGGLQQYRAQQVRQDQDRMVGDWISADSSDNTLQIAETNDPDLLALRNSFSHGRVIYATRSQLREFARNEQVQNLARN